ncbi:MAG: hypothetical protein IKU51_03915 [Clostridia bacterium]|nr:hypothetical protein [Clostridia bacterium]
MKKRTKKTFGVGCKVFVRLLLALLMCAILYVSLSVISTGLLSESVGYRLYEQAEDESVDMIEEHYYTVDEEVLTSDDFELKENQMFTAIRVVPEGTQKVVNVVSQILMLIILSLFPYNVLWQFGSRDDVNVRYRGQKEDRMRGVKIGLIGNAPFAFLWVLLLLSRFGLISGGFIQLYRFLAFPFLPYVNWILGSGTTVNDIDLWRILLLLPTLLVVPLVCGVAYRMGGTQFSIIEFITFAKKKEQTDEGEI